MNGGLLKALFGSIDNIQYFVALLHLGTKDVKKWTRSQYVYYMLLGKLMTGPRNLILP